MATVEQTVQEEQTELDSNLGIGSVLMALAGVAFVGYGIVFFAWNFVGSGFEIGVTTVGGLAPADLNPALEFYVTHLQIATAGFIIATGIAVAGLSYYGVRDGQRWAWVTAVVAPVVGLALAIPLHWWPDAFSHDWVAHLGPIYLATIVFVVGAVISLRGLLES